MFAISTPKQAPRTQASVIPAPTAIATQQFSQAINNTPTSSEYIYVGNNFQVIYPASIYTASGNKNNGEDNIVLEHKKSSSSDPGDYSVYFQIASSSSVPLQNILNVLDGFRYAKTITNLDGIQVVRYDGSIANNSIHNSAIVFAKNNLTYQIELTYQASQEDTVIQNLFNQLLTNVKIY